MSRPSRLPEPTIMQIMLVDPYDALPAGTTGLLANHGWDVVRHADYLQAASELSRGAFDALILSSPSSNSGTVGSSPFEQLLRVAESRHIGGLLVTNDPGSVVLAEPNLVNVIPPDTSKEQIRDRLMAVSGYRALVQVMERELESMRHIGERLKKHFLEVDQEMRLAGRLQRDFLPRNLESQDRARFAALYRPASWVSGDIYDVFRVDEHHLAFYIADAVGHGMAASLLTMFIKRSVVSKRIEGNDYTILDPSETLDLLNEALTGQDLPHCQFVTALYCLLNTKTLELRYARGGHTYPLLITRNGELRELESEGGLMGLFKGERFPTGAEQLEPGDKIVLYTDGIECAFSDRDGKQTGPISYVDMFRPFGNYPVDEMIHRLDGMLNAECGSLHPRDDVTVLACEITS